MLYLFSFSAFSCFAMALTDPVMARPNDRREARKISTEFATARPDSRSALGGPTRVASSSNVVQASSQRRQPIHLSATKESTSFAGRFLLSFLSSHRQDSSSLVCSGPHTPLTVVRFSEPSHKRHHNEDQTLVSKPTSAVYHNLSCPSNHSPSPSTHTSSLALMRQRKTWLPMPTHKSHRGISAQSARKRQKRLQTGSRPCLLVRSLFVT